VPLAARESHAVRFAWWASFLATIALVALLGLARSAQAATVADPLLSVLTLPAGAEADEEAEAAAEEEGEGLEECEEPDEEEECEEAAEVDDSCVLKSAEATILVLPFRNEVKLTLRYSTFSPAVVKVRYSLRGGRGRLKMGGESRRFGYRGVFRETEELTEAEMAKARAATGFEVDARAVNTPGRCRGLFDRKLTARHATHGGLAWVD